METIQGLETVEMKIKDFFLQYPIVNDEYVEIDGKIEVKRSLSRCGLGAYFNDDDIISIKRPSAFEFDYIQKTMNDRDFDICKMLEIKINGADIKIADIAKKLDYKSFMEFNKVLVFFMKNETILI